MNQEIITIIKRQFPSKDSEIVIKEMSSITLDHVMALSEENLNNTLAAILKLAKGDINEVARLVECAKQDFRDVIYWASMQ